MELIKERFWFAYGSNMDQAQMSFRCPSATLHGKATLNGYRFIINSRGVATIVQNQSSAVYGVLWRITITDEEVLDGYEGIDWGTYYKSIVQVAIGQGKQRKVLTYIAADDTQGVPTAGYIERIIQVAEQHKLPSSYVEELKSWSRIDDKSS